jgi:hypothetical protein
LTATHRHDHTPQLSTLLLDAPVGRHFAQLHSDPKDLVESVGMFVETGLRRGNGVVVVAARETMDSYLSRLKDLGIDTEEARRSGQLVLRNAEDSLARIMVGDMPDWANFRRLVGSMIEEVQAFGRSTTRAYGEMVNVLWRGGQPLAAIRLEEYWNELARLYPFSLFCGYMVDSHEHETYKSPLAEIGRTHTDVLTTQKDERFREALDYASRDIYGIPLAQLVTQSGHEDGAGERRLPEAQRTMLWIMRHLPESSADVLRRVRHYYQNGQNGDRAAK